MSATSRWTAYQPPAPNVGAVLQTCVPYRNMANPTIRPHPAIVVKRYEFQGHFVLMVVGGTAIYDARGIRKRDWPGEIDLDEDLRKSAGLSKPTKFGFNRNSIRLLPFTDQFFMPDPARRPLGYGHVPMKSGAFWEAIVAHGFDTLLKELSTQLISEYLLAANLTA